jgi:hypothetical protein
MAKRKAHEKAAKIWLAAKALKMVAAKYAWRRRKRLSNGGSGAGNLAKWHQRKANGNGQLMALMSGESSEEKLKSHRKRKQRRNKLSKWRKQRHRAEKRLAGMLSKPSACESENGGSQSVA